MALAMARPFKHPRSGVYYFRKAVPEELRPILKRVEVLRSLGTKDPAEARRLHAEVAAQVEREWTAQRQPARSLTFQEIVALAGEWYRQTLELWQADPGAAEATAMRDAITAALLDVERQDEAGDWQALEAGRFYQPDWVMRFWDFGVGWRSSHVGFLASGIDLPAGVMPGLAGAATPVRFVSGRSAV